MTKYGVNYYGASNYGAFAQTAYSVEPMSALVLDFTRIYVSWQSPRGDFSQVRLVRNQAGYPETAEDGVIIFDESATEGTVTRSYIIDGQDNPTDIPFVAGRQTYYRFFIFTSDKVWRVAGSISVVAPSNHMAQENFINSLPRVFTTDEQSPLGAVNASSTLYKFLDGLLFTHEELLTYLDLLRPKHTGLELPEQLISADTINLGLTPEPSLPTKNQKRLIREAHYMYSRKGTKPALQTYVESLSGFAPEITTSANLLLTVQDSTFYGGIGNWSASSATLTSSTDQVAAPGTNVIDATYTGKIVASASGSMTLGADSPITKGVPVSPSTQYTVSCKLKSPTSAGNITISVRFYDLNGNPTSLINNATAVAANNTWKSASVTATSDANSSYSVITIAYSASGTYYVDQVCLQAGSAVAYDEARAVNIFLDPIKSNLIHNPSFETNTTDGWTLTGAASASVNSDVSNLAYSGANSAKIVATGNWTYTSNDMPVLSGNYYTSSGLLKTTADLTLTLIGKDSGGNTIESYDMSDLGTISAWSRFIYTHLVDVSDNDVITYSMQFSGGAGTYYLDCIQFEKSPKASDYFDGSLPSDFGAVWEGTENNSASHLYPNKPQKLQRLRQSINDWIPMNTFWRLSTYAGLEYTNLTV